MQRVRDRFTSDRQRDRGDSDRTPFAGSCAGTRRMISEFETDDSTPEWPEGGEIEDGKTANGVGAGRPSEGDRVG